MLVFSVMASTVILVLPLIEYFVLRVLFHSVLNIRIGFVGMVDSHVLVPAVLAGGFVLALLNRTEKIGFKFSPIRALVHAGLLSVFVTATLLTQWTSEIRGETYYWAWFGLGVCTIVSSGFIGVSPRYFLNHPHRILIVPAIGVSLSKVIGQHLVPWLWEPMGQITGRVTYAVARLFSSNISFELLTKGKTTHSLLIYPGYSISIGNGCSGLDGVFLFLALWCFVPFLQKSTTSVHRWTLGLLLGSLWMYCINIVRLLLFHAVGIFTVQQLGAGMEIRKVLRTLHDGSGVFISVIGFALFWVIYSKYLQETPQETPKTLTPETI